MTPVVGNLVLIFKSKFLQTLAKHPQPHNYINFFYKNGGNLIIDLIKNFIIHALHNKKLQNKIMQKGKFQRFTFSFRCLPMIS
jgi:hypothetical protein